VEGAFLLPFISPFTPFVLYFRPYQSPFTKNGSSFHSFHPSFHPEMPMDRAFQRIGERMEGDFSILWGGGNICFMKVKFIDMKG
jgi:hypothetical protein